MTHPKPATREVTHEERTARPRPAPMPSAQPPEFPGCRPVSISREAIADYEGRFEYWDAETGIAWVCEPTSVYHEQPSQRLARLVALIAAVRGSPIETFGTADLLRRDAHGGWQSILQADQMVYLHPKETRPRGPAVEVGDDVLPDVVLEVDHTTDVRRRKLGLYETRGFPEVWVEVPEARSPSRPRGRLPGLVIHVLVEGAYRVVSESRAFPGWRAAEIHLAMNEAELSAETVAVLERVGLALGSREGTGPEDDLLLRSQRRQGFDVGHAQGRAEGREEGMAQGHAAGIAQGREEGIERERALLCRQAERRFGVETGDRLAVLLAGIDDAARLAEVGDRVVDCATGAELLAHAGSSRSPI